MPLSLRRLQRTWVLGRLRSSTGPRETRKTSPAVTLHPGYSTQRSLSSRLGFSKMMKTQVCAFDDLSPPFLPRRNANRQSKAKRRNSGSGPCGLGNTHRNVSPAGGHAGRMGRGLTQLPPMALSFYFVPHSWGGLFMCSMQLQRLHASVLDTKRFF